MAVFKNIPQVRRVVYERTFMNEISLLFTYNTIKLDIASEVIARLAPDMHLDIKNIDKDGEKEAILIEDKNALITFTPNAVLVSLPTREYMDFTKTEFLWNDVEILLRELEVCPIVWSFTKGNRWVFNKAILPEQENEVYKVVLSENLLKGTAKEHIYVEEYYTDVLENLEGCVSRNGIELIVDSYVIVPVGVPIILVEGKLFSCACVRFADLLQFVASNDQSVFIDHTNGAANGILHLMQNALK